MNIKKMLDIIKSKRECLIFMGALLFPFVIIFSCTKEKDIFDNGNDNRETMILVEDPLGIKYEGEEPEYQKLNVFNNDVLYPGFENFRIPALITTNQGTLIAFSEMRTGGDFDPKTLVFRRSVDNGETWSAVTLAEELTISKLYGNENLIVDKKTGVIHLVYLQIFPAVSGSNACTMFHKVSTDDGVTWSQRKTIPNVVSATWRPLGPAAGIQLGRGVNAGRLLIPGRYSDNQSGSYAIFSDNGGETWELGFKTLNNHDIGNENEVTCVELSETNGNESVIYINSRNQKDLPTAYRRMEAYSHDSGKSIVNGFQQNNFIQTDKIQGALYRWSSVDKGDARDRILFSALDIAKIDLTGSVLNRRRHAGIWSTFDETETWTKAAKRITDMNSGYTSITKTADGYIGVLFEEGEGSYFRETNLVKINEAFLDEPLIGARWDFESLSPNIDIPDGTTLGESFTNGTSRDITVIGTLSTVAGSNAFMQKTALNFDGNSFLKLNDIDTWTQFDFNDESSFTVEMIVKVRKTNGPQFLIGRPYKTNWPQWFLRIEDDGTVSFRIDDDQNSSIVKSKEDIMDNKWHHIAAVRDRDTRKIKIYVDGQLSNEVTDEVSGSLANRRSLYVAGTESTVNHFKGELDFVRISPSVIKDFFK